MSTPFEPMIEILLLTPTCCTIVNNRTLAPNDDFSPVYQDRSLTPIWTTYQWICHQQIEVDDHIRTMPVTELWTDMLKYLPEEGYYV